MVTVYSKASCAQCNATKRHLKKHGIEFREVMIDQDPAALEKVLGWGFQQAPVVEAPSGERWSGFRPDLLKALAPERTERPAFTPAFA